MKELQNTKMGQLFFVQSFCQRGGGGGGGYQAQTHTWFKGGCFPHGIHARIKDKPF